MNEPCEALQINEILPHLQFWYRAPNGVASYLEEAFNDPALQKSVELWEQNSSRAGKCHATCICAFLCLQLGHAASALQLAWDILEVR